MKNRFLKNKEILGFAKNYYKIVNEEYFEEDNISYKIIEIYREYLISLKNLTELTKKRIEKFDMVVNKYFEDFEFRKELSEGIKNLKVKRNTQNVLEDIVDNLLLIYNKYVESYTRNIYIPKWI